MDINQFFDFKAAWNEIVSIYKDGDKFDMDMINLIESHSIKEHIMNPYFEMDNEECEISADQIIFTFGKEFQTANESNPENEHIWITIIYDSFKDDFISYQYC